MARQRNPSRRVQGGEREFLLEDVLAHTLDGVFAVDRSWNYRFLNEAAARLVGRTREELVGANIWQAFPEAVGSVFETRFREALERQEHMEFEEHFEPLGRWYAIRVHPSPDGLTIYFTDTTERHVRLRELEERARQQSALAALSRTLLAAAASPDGPNVISALAEAAQALSSTLDAPVVEILGQTSELSPATVVARAGPAALQPSSDAQPGGEACAAAVRVAVPGAAPAVTELVIHPRRGGSLSAEASDFVGSVAVLLASAVHQFELSRAARRQALHDPLLGLPNRRLLLSHLEQLLGERHPGETAPAVLALSVDRFWLITSSYGHAAGDELLAELARRIQSVTDPHGMLARLSGDFFVLVLDAPIGEFEPQRVAGRLRDALRDPLQLASGEHFLELNLGIVHVDPGATPDDLLRDADAALRRAAESGRTVVLDDAMRAETVHRADLNRELHRALERRELILHYQPLIDLASSRPVGAEALLRWNHPERGLVMPGEFIAAAEENGLIVPIGAWVLEQAVADCASLRAQLGRPVRVSVNVSSRQLTDPSFVDFAVKLVDHERLEHGALELEVTESLLLDYGGAGLEALERLRARGIRVALDDFGTGYSALSHLTQLSVDTLKVDRSFIERMSPGEGTAIVEAIIQMAHAVRLKVIAEGVETEDQRLTLESLGCDELQGYLYSRPVPFDAILELMR